MKCYNCGNKWHYETLLSPQEQRVFQKINRLFPPFKEEDRETTEGTWYVNSSCTISLATESDTVIRALQEADPSGERDHIGEIEYDADIVVGKRLLMKMIEAVDGQRIRLRVRSDSVVRADGVNWRKQVTSGILASIDGDSHVAEDVRDRTDEFDEQVVKPAEKMQQETVGEGDT